MAKVTTEVKLLLVGVKGQGEFELPSGLLRSHAQGLDSALG